MNLLTLAPRISIVGALLLMADGPAWARLKVEVAARENPQEAAGYPNTLEGFRSQFGAVVKAYCAGDVVEGRRRLHAFALPDPDAWFSSHFEASDAASLSRRYQTFFKDEADSTEKTLQDLCTDKQGQLVMRESAPLSHPFTAPARFRLATTKPIQEVQLASFTFGLQFHGAETSSWEDTYVYERGSFRHVGGGDLPFWGWAEGAGPGAFRGGRYSKPPTIIHHVDPDYPLAARARHIQGTVIVKASVDKEGNVKSVTLIRGNPALDEAAMKAVKKWRYQPMLLGGVPIEFETVVTVEFRV